MRYYLSLTILGIGIHGWAQQISPSVTATSGNTLQNGSVALDFTIGEPVTNSYQNGPVLLTQGFHQPVISLADISEWEEANIQRIGQRFKVVVEISSLLLVVEDKKVVNIRFMKDAAGEKGKGRSLYVFERE